MKPVPPQTHPQCARSSSVVSSTDPRSRTLSVSLAQDTEARHNTAPNTNNLKCALSLKVSMSHGFELCPQCDELSYRISATNSKGLGGDVGTREECWCVIAPGFSLGRGLTFTWHSVGAGLRFVSHLIQHTCHQLTDSVSSFDPEATQRFRPALATALAHQCKVLSSRQVSSCTPGLYQPPSSMQ